MVGRGKAWCGRARQGKVLIKEVILKHFNQGTCWGKISKIKLEKSEKKTPYLSLEIECGNEIFGNIRTFGRLWGQDRIDALFDYYKKHPGAAYKLKGFFSQYSKNDNRYSNFTFFSWQPFEGTEFRAAFVLKGLVTAIEGDKICLHIEREGSGNYADIEEDFELHVLNQQDIAGINEGDVVQCKGAIRYHEGEDYFGGSPSGKILPYIMELKKLTNEIKEEVF